MVMGELKKRNITMETIADIAFDLQKNFYPDANKAEFLEAANDVLHKREVLNNAMVALELDGLSTEGQLKQPLQNIVANDSGVIAVAYGTSGVTSIGDVERVTTGVTKELETQKDGRVKTSLDDLGGAVAAGGAAKLARRCAER